MFTFTKLDIPELVLIESQRFDDNRGAFSEIWKASDFKKQGIPTAFDQDNYSLSKKGVIRGLHYQLEPMEQGKIVRVLSGRVWDVAVDIRKGSPHFGKWSGVELTRNNNKMLWIPGGFAHGFAALEDDTLLLYKTTKEYSKAHERGILWNDSDIDVDWKVDDDPIVSDKDKALPPLKSAEYNFTYKK